jgi:hypothetical protein
MPARPPHIPHAIERSALQKLMGSQGLSKDRLHPAGKHTLAKMLAKGWIERRSELGGVRYLITPDGEAALKAPIPMPRRVRQPNLSPRPTGTTE